MNLNTIRPKSKTEDFSLSKTKNCETLIKQTHTKAQETLEFKFTKSIEIFAFKPSIILGLDSNWMIGSTSLKIHTFF